MAIRKLGEGVGKPGLRIDGVELAGLDQAGDIIDCLEDTDQL